MVHIINGEIVQDNDPRVLARKQPQAQGQGDARRRPIAGMNSLGGASSPQQAQQPQAQVQATGGSPLQGLARTLGIDGAVTIPGFLGFPPRQVEKIYLALSALAVLLFGWRALIFLAFAFFLSTQQPAQ